MKSYIDKAHTRGKIWSVLAIIVLFSVPTLICVHNGAWPTLGDVFNKNIISVLAIYWISAVVEVITYTPMLGAGGTYLSFVTGNIANLKLPCALNALEQAGVKSNSEEGEVVSTIAIAVSSIVTTLIILIGVICIVPLTPVLESPVLVPAFDMILPALFGGLAVVFISKNLKLSIAPIILMLALFIFIPALNASTVGIMVPVGVVFTVIVARILYKKGVL